MAASARFLGGADMTNDEVKALVIALRGGLPEKCDFCGKETAEPDLHPEEAGAWACTDCLRRWGDIQ